MRPPVFDREASSFLWAVVFAVFIYFGGLAVGFAKGLMLIVALVAGFAIFLFVRVYGEDEPRRP